MIRKFHILVSVSTVALLLFFVGSSVAKDMALDDFSLEDLNALGLSNAPKSVTASTAAKVNQTTADAPSVLRIVTAEDIRTYGYQTLDDILRSLPGLYTTYDGTNTYLGVRGLGRPGDYNTRVLILIDGVRVNDNVFDSALVGREFPLDVGLIERLEYAPGPGSAVYGRNAFFGVINVITKNGNWYDGIELTGGGGTFNTRKMRLSYGKRFDSGSEVLLSVSDFQNSDVGDSYTEEFDAYDSDFNKNRSFFGKFSSGGFQTEIVYSARNSGTHVYPETELINEYNEVTEERTIIDARYSKNFGNDWTAEISASYNQYLFKGSYPYVDYYYHDGVGVIDTESYPGEWLDGEVRIVNTHFEKHRILLGIEGHGDLRLESEAGVVGEDPYFYEEGKNNSYGVYLQDDIVLTDTFKLLVGGRYDYTEFGDNLNPRLGLIWQPRDESTFKLLYGSAFRTANFFEAGINRSVENFADYTIDDPSLETIKTVEFGVEHYLNPSTKLSGSLYYYRLDDIIEENLDEEWVYTYLNGQPVEAKGFEFEAEKRFASGTKLDLNYALQKTENSEGDRLSNSPAHLLNLRSSIPLWFEHGRVGAEAKYMSERTTGEDDTIDPYWLVNLTMTCKIGNHIDVLFGIYNLTDTEYYDPVRAGLEGLEQEGRSVYVQLDAKF